MPARLKLYVDWHNQKLTKGPTSAADFKLPTFYQGAVVPMQVQIIEPDPSGSPHRSVIVDPTGISLQLALFDSQPIGTSGTPTPIVTQYNWTPDTAGKFLYADVALNTTELNTAIGANASIGGWFELKMTEGSATTPLVQKQITIAAGGIEATTEEVAAGETPLSLEVANQRYAQKFMALGDSIILQSADGTRHIRIYCGDDGSLRQETF